MSDTSQGDGWWQASDLKWYPPDQVPGTGAGTADPAAGSASGHGAPEGFGSPGPGSAGFGSPGGYGAPGPSSGYAPGPAQPGPGGAPWGAPSPYGPPPGSGLPGYSPYGAPVPGGSGLPSVNGLATASLVLGILGIILSFCLIGGVLGIIGLPLGLTAMNKISSSQADPSSRGLALAGAICSGIGVAIAGLILVAAVAT